MKRASVLLVVILILIAGIIIGLSVLFVRTPIKKPSPPSTGGGFRVPDRPAPDAIKVNHPALLNETFAKGARWLVAQQLANGAWAAPPPDSTADVGFTALALIALGAAPEPARSNYTTAIEQGVKYLLDHIQENGSVLDPGKMPSYAIYKTSLAAVALATIDKQKYEVPLKKIRDYLVRAQFGPEDGDAQSGGWGYSEKGAEPVKNANLSTSEFAMEALHRLDLPKDSETWQRAIEFLQRVQNSSEWNKFRVTSEDGGFAYSPIESKAGEEVLPDGTKVLKSYASMTYAGLLSFIYAYVDKNDPRVQAAYQWCCRNYNLDENIGLRTDIKPEAGKQGLFYYYHTLAKALDAYGEPTITDRNDLPHPWAKELLEKLADLQKEDGTWVNEAEEKWFEGYKLLCTCYCLMALHHCRKWVEVE